MLSSSTLRSAVSGGLYKSGLRPLNSVAEDVVVNFVSGTSGQIQEGVANVNIFVPDIDNGSGAMVCNVARCRYLEGVASEWVDSLRDSSDGYHFELDEMIQTMPYEDGKQHLISVRLSFKYITF